MKDILDHFIQEDPYSLENIKDRIRRFSYKNSRYKPADIRASINRLIKANREVHLSEIIEIKLKIDNYKTNTPLDEFIKNIIKRNEEVEIADKIDKIKFEDYFHHIILSNDEKDEVIKILVSYYKSFYNKRENTDIER